MNNPNDGLPLPKLPLRPSVPPQLSPDIDPGTVKRSFSDILDNSKNATQQWAHALDTRARVTGDPTYVPFQGSGAAPLNSPQSMLDHAAGMDPTTPPSASEAAKAAAKELWEFITHPIASTTDEVQVKKIRALQDQFRSNHDPELKDLSNILDAGKGYMRQLADLLSNANLSTAKIDQILAAKREIGNSEYSQIQDALNQTTDPDEQTRLAGMRDDLANWMQERDARLSAEQPEIDALKERFANVKNELQRQAGALRDAGRSSGPRNLTYTADGQVLQTDHTSPSAVTHVVSLHDFLLGDRVAFNNALNGGN